MVRRGKRCRMHGWLEQGTRIMWHLLLLAIAACLSTPLLSAPVAAREVADAAGRAPDEARDGVLAGSGDPWR